jgi:hypothetical protein
MFSIVFHYQSFAKQRSSLPLAEKDFLSISPVEKEYDGFLER